MARPGLLSTILRNLIIDPLVNTSFDGFEDASQAMVLSVFVVAKSAFPSTVDAGGGSFVVSDTTASLRGRGRFFHTPLPNLRCEF